MSTQRTPDEAETSLDQIFEDTRELVAARAISGQAVNAPTNSGDTVWNATDPSLRASRFKCSLLQDVDGRLYVVGDSEPQGPGGCIMARAFDEV